MDGEELIGKCRNFLQEKSILLCSMMYGKKTWGEVQYALFGNDKSSRIMVTTRNRNVAEFCKTSALVHVRELKPLPYSWHKNSYAEQHFNSTKRSNIPWS